jgi:amylosucrase
MLAVPTLDDRSRRAAAWIDGRLPALVRLAGERLPERDAAAFADRVALGAVDLYLPLDEVYGAGHATDDLVDRLLDVALDAAVARPDELRRLDHRREIEREWFQRSRAVGYVAYVDRFAGDLSGVEARLDYLAELGVTYLHLMPLLRPREGENDGGYAVADYRSVDPRLGTIDDLERLAAALRHRGMSLCIDLVMNHTAREHEWARQAMAGSARHRRFFHVFPDRTEPDRYEATLREVFPDFAPGNFSFVPELNGWVWTTFHDFQWDLNYANPDVLAAMLDTMLFLANRGVEILRLDAAPFIWKRMGTDCENQPEAHRILQALRALVRIGAPAVAFKAEAIVAPEQLVQYLGAHDVFEPECDLAYNNQLMVMSWSSLAARDASLMTVALQRLRPAPPSTAWVTYVRCHDDIGWAVSDEDAVAVGLNGFAHRRFLNEFYSGVFPGSYALGATFQENPATGDARIAGTAAALCGIELARASADADELERGIRRLVLLYSIAFSYGGIPLVYMGDEIALGNDHSYVDDPATSGDVRWINRPVMDWDAAGRRKDPTTVEGRVFDALASLVDARRRLMALRGGGDVRLRWTDAPAVLAYQRHHARSRTFLALVNFADHPVMCDAGILATTAMTRFETVCSSDGPLRVHDGRIHLPGLAFAWLLASA